jgi:hypothetical protein
MPITEANKKESVEFMEALTAMLEIIDNIAPLIGDGNYLQLCNNLKKLNENNTKETVIQYIEVVRERVRNNVIVRNQERRANMKVKDNRILTDAEKLKNGWCICNRCDRLVLNLREHNFTDVCIRTHLTKKVSSSSYPDVENFIRIIHILRAIFLKYQGYKYYMKLIKKAL